MKKFLSILSILFFCVACSCSSDKAADVVERYLNNYKNLSDEVIGEIDNLANAENLSDKNKEIYKDVLKRQYKDLLFTIENEEYNGDEANVTVKITVYDLYKVQKDASKYLQEHEEEFLNNGEYDEEKYITYKLEQMRDTNESLAYNVVFKVKKQNGNWVVEQPDIETLEKIHGVYDYNLD